jgi:alpha-glucosidase
VAPAAAEVGGVDAVVLGCPGRKRGGDHDDDPLGHFLDGFKRGEKPAQSALPALDRRWFEQWGEQQPASGQAGQGQGNHDVERHVSRWAEFAPDPESFGRFCIALLVCLRGTICIYQGEELGLPEADVPFELLQDPYGKQFWPEFKGRDGCRTPIPWEAKARNAGFSTAEHPWLPVPGSHYTHAAAIDGEPNPATLTADYRRLIALRHAHPALMTGSIALRETPGALLAFTREGGSERLLCLFNFGKVPASFDIPAGENLNTLEGAATGAVIETRKVSLTAGGFIITQLETLGA